MITYDNENSLNVHLQKFSMLVTFVLVINRIYATRDVTIWHKQRKNVNIWKSFICVLAANEGMAYNN